MITSLVSIGQTAVRGAVLGHTVLAARAPADLGSLHLLDGDDTSECPEIRVGEAGVLLLDGLEEVPDDLEAGVGAMVGLGRETHGSTIGTTVAGILVVRARAVPCQSNKGRAVRAVIVLLGVQD